MRVTYQKHNLFTVSVNEFETNDPHLSVLARLAYQYGSDWWRDLDLAVPGIYILTGGRQVGKSTSCKLLIKQSLKDKRFKPSNIFYLPCDEIFDAKTLSQIIRDFIDNVDDMFLLIIDEVTYVPHWERIIKALADEGGFTKGICLLTGSDTLILKEAAMSFPGRRGAADQVDFHLYPLSFSQFVNLMQLKNQNGKTSLKILFDEYMQCGGYLRAINDFKSNGKVSVSTLMTYEQWIRGDFLKHGKNEQSLLAVLNALLTIGVSPISYSSLTQKIGTISKETCIDYLRLLERMDVLIVLQAYDKNKKQGFPRKDRKFHFFDPFIYNTMINWLNREGFLKHTIDKSVIAEAITASHCVRRGSAYYFKGAVGEVDVISIHKKSIQAIEVKWSQQIRPNDFKTLHQFKNNLIISKLPFTGMSNGVPVQPIYEFLNKL